VLSVNGTDVKITDTLTMPDSVGHVMFTPDGKHALAARNAANKVSILDVADGKVAYNKVDLPTSPWPYNIVVTPDSKLALVNETGGGGSSDGNIDTTSVIDLSVNPPRMIDHIVVGDGPEGLAMSPKGNVAAAAILRGSNMKKAFFHEKTGSVAIMTINGKKVTKTQEVDVGGLPEAILFTPDGKYLLAGNYMDEDFSILKVDGTKVTDTGKRFKLPGHPASARMGP
jgi:DNA-binding beta-propeller fold protein YncE